jgi:hypothetical protein
MADKRVVPEPLVYEHQGNSTAFRPQAAPVDRYIKPTEPLKSTLWDVAQSVAEVNPKIHAYLRDAADEGAAADKKKAEADAMVSEAKTYQEAIDKGQISPGQSPIYQRVFQETLGKNEALSTASATIQKAWYSSDNPIRNSQNPQEINAWLNQQTQAMLKDKNPDWVKGFIPQLNAVKQQLVQKWVGESVQNLEEENRNAYGTLVMNRLQTMKGQPPAAIADALANDTIPQQFAGMSRKDINKMQAQAIIDTATKTGDASLLRVGYEDRPDIKNPGQVIPGVFKIPGFAQRAQAAETAILSKAHVQESRSLAAQHEADRKARTAIQGEIFLNRSKDPTWMPDAAFNERISKIPGGPEAAASAISAQHTVAQKAFDPLVYSAELKNVDTVLNNTSTSAEQRDAALNKIYAYAKSPADVQTINRMFGVGEHANDGLITSEVYKMSVQSLAQQLQTAIEKKVDSQVANAKFTSGTDQLREFVYNYTKARSGKVDMNDFSKAVQEKRDSIIREFQELQKQTDNARPAPGAPPGSPRGAAPATPAQKAPAAPAAPLQPPVNQQQGSTEVPAAAPVAAVQVPTDRLINTNDALGRFSGESFTLKTGDGLDLKSINTLRSDPNKDINGKPLWKVFDERFGDGASQFLLSANEGQIKYAIKKTAFTSRKDKPFTTTVDDVVDVLLKPPSNRKSY